MDHPLDGPEDRGCLVAFDIPASGSRPTLKWRRFLSHAIDPFAITKVGATYVMVCMGDSGNTKKIYTSASLRGLFTDAPARDWAAPYVWSNGFQHMSFVKGLDGLFLVATENQSPVGGGQFGEDWAYLYKADYADSTQTLTLSPAPVVNKHLTCNTDQDGVGRTGNFAAGACLYVSPKGELILYSIPHTICAVGDTVVPMAEFRISDVGIPWGTAWQSPRANAGEGYVVNKGGKITLSGRGIPAASPWIDLYDESLGWNGLGRRVLVELSDSTLIDTNNFKLMDGIGTLWRNGFSDTASSLRYYLPDGVSVRLYRDINMGGGYRERKQTNGNPFGYLGNLSDIGMNNDIDSLEFVITENNGLKPPGCGNTLQYAWDFYDGTGYSHPGRSVTYSAPRTVGDYPAALRVTDGYAGSTGRNEGGDLAWIQVVNGAPSCGSGGTAPFYAAPGVEIGLSPVYYSDPDVAETITAKINWGDGSGWENGQVKQDFRYTEWTQGVVEGTHVYAREGEYTVTVNATDADGASSAPYTYVQKVVAGPTTTMQVSGTQGFNGWFTTPAEVSFTAKASAGLSVDGIYYQLPDETDARRYRDPYVCSIQGDTTISHWAFDYRSQGLVKGPVTADTIRVDTVAPHTTTDERPLYQNPWCTIHLTPKDYTSGPARVYYQVDDDEVKSQEYDGYAAPVSVVGLGMHTLKYWSQDLAGNVEAPHTARFEIINQSPQAGKDVYRTGMGETLVVVAPGVLENDSDYEGDPLTARLVPELGGPSHGTLSFESDGSFVYTPVQGFSGFDMFYYEARDGNGGMVAPVTIEVVVDTTPPVVTLSVAPASPDGSAGWYLTMPAITASADGPATFFYSWGSDVGPWTSWLDPAAPVYAPSGQSTFHYYAVDASANPSDVASRTFKVDTVAPPKAATPYWTSIGPTSVSLAWASVADAPSGVASYEIYDGGALVGTTGGTTYTHGGLTPGSAHTYTVAARDVAGNLSAISSQLAVTIPSTSAEAPVGEGTDVTVPVTVTTDEGPAEITVVFDQVAEPGSLIVAPLPAAPAGAPEGFQILGGGRFDVSFTGTFAGELQVGFPYDPSISDADALDLKVQHWKDNEWHDVTDRVDTAAHLVWARVSSLSPFVLLEPENAAPVAADDGPYATPEGSELTLPAPGVLANDTDADGDTLTASKVTDPAHGMLALAADGSFTYTPTMVTRSRHPKSQTLRTARSLWPLTARLSTRRHRGGREMTRSRIAPTTVSRTRTP